MFFACAHAHYNYSHNSKTMHTSSVEGQPGTEWQRKVSSLHGEGEAGGWEDPHLLEHRSAVTKGREGGREERERGKERRCRNLIFTLYSYTYYAHYLASYPGRCGGGKDGLVSTLRACAATTRFSGSPDNTVFYSTVYYRIWYSRTHKCRGNTRAGYVIRPWEIQKELDWATRTQSNPFADTAKITGRFPRNKRDMCACANSRYQAVFSAPATAWVRG